MKDNTFESSKDILNKIFEKIKKNIRIHDLIKEELSKISPEIETELFEKGVLILKCKSNIEKNEILLKEKEIKKKLKIKAGIIIKQIFFK